MSFAPQWSRSTIQSSSIAVSRDDPATIMPVKSLMPLFAITEYVRSGSRFPALMLSVIHSGRTTCIFVLLFDVSSLCVLDPFSCCEVRMWVAPEGVYLKLFLLSTTGKVRNGRIVSYNVCPPARVIMRFISMSVVSSKYPFIYTATNVGQWNLGICSVSRKSNLGHCGGRCPLW